MLQRAASNAYSWWWASHIRTKQSKWLEQNLKDMEEKVKTVLKMIEEDGDSFAKRAEMYYKKRPELINFVEDSYRAYRALAERYDHISNELQNANNTIASVFPEQVQFSMEEEDEDATSKIPKKASQASNKNVPEAPKGPELKSLDAAKAASSKRLLLSKSKKAVSVASVPQSGLQKGEALEEIDRLQKRILALQTEKEFVKSSYENGLAKYWEIESDIKAMQERVCALQDEFGEGMVIEDGEARSLMAETAIKSCQETLTQLQEKLKKSTEEASVESLRFKDVRDKFESLKGEFCDGERGKSGEPEEGSSGLEQEDESKAKEGEELEMLRAKIKEQFEVKSSTAFTVTDMVEKVDELVNKVISLETAVSSQAALVERLKTETDDLQAQIRSLEDDKASLIDGKNSLNNKLKEMDDKLKGIQFLNRSFKDQSNNLKLHFTEANCNLDHLSDKLQTVRPDEEELNIASASSEIEFDFGGEAYLQENFNTKQVIANPFEDFPSPRNPFEDYEEIPASDSQQEIKADPIETSNNVSTLDSDHADQNQPNSMDSQAKDESEDEPDWQKMFTDGMEDREKILLKEYTSTLRNYKDVKKKLGEAEKKSRDGHFETTQQLRDLKSSNAKKDDEIRALRLKLGLLEDTLISESPSKASKTPQEEEEEEKQVFTEQTQEMSAMEEKFRTEIDELLEQNLEFWLRFSTSFHQIQEFETEVEDLKSELKKLQEKRSSAITNRDTLQSLLRSDARPLYTHMREIEAKLTVWLEKSALLSDELQCRFSSLCEIQDSINKALKACAEDEDGLLLKFTSHQAAKFQGEVENMKQENNKVAEELQAGIDRAAALRSGAQRTLARLDEEFELAGSSKGKSKSKSKNGDEKEGQSQSRSRVPLRSFIFGVKSKKQKGSIFACVTPAMQRKYLGLRVGPPF